MSLSKLDQTSRIESKVLDSENGCARRVLDDITVVVPTVGRPILKDALERIAAGTAWPAQIIVVDQSSSSLVRSWIEQLQSVGLDAQHLPSCQTGKAAALNRGIERVTTRFAAITDDDCFVSNDWLEKIVTRLRQRPKAVVTGPAHPEGENKVVSAVTSTKPLISRRPGLRFDTFCGSNMGAAVTLLRGVGSFDEDLCLRAAEDCEWSYRVLRQGIPIIYAPEVVVRHFGWRNADQCADRHRDYARSLGGFYGKYLRQGDWFIALRVVLTVLRAIRRWARGVITGNAELSLSGRSYVVDLIPGIVAGWRNGRVR